MFPGGARPARPIKLLSYKSVILVSVIVPHKEKYVVAAEITGHDERMFAVPAKTLIQFVCEGTWGRSLSGRSWINPNKVLDVMLPIKIGKEC